MPMKKVTSHDVARVAGVSRTVVSRAFSNQGRVSQKNRDLVMRVASQLGYAPDAIAQSLHSGKTGFVAVVVNHFHDLSDLEFFDRLVSITIPRIRDFRGLSRKSFDGRGNYTMGVKEQIVFLEIDRDKISKISGMDICICTSAENNDEGMALLEEMGMPFRK